jgi:hypothetical protein
MSSEGLKWEKDCPPANLVVWLRLGTTSTSVGNYELTHQHLHKEGFQVNSNYNLHDK